MNPKAKKYSYQIAEMNKENLGAKYRNKLLSEKEIRPYSRFTCSKGSVQSKSPLFPSSQQNGLIKM